VTIKQPVNWVKVAIRLTDYINDIESQWAKESQTPARTFKGPLEVIEMLDKADELVWLLREKEVASNGE
jgi:hypothetical protein